MAKLHLCHWPLPFAKFRLHDFDAADRSLRVLIRCQDSVGDRIRGDSNATYNIGHSHHSIRIGDGRLVDSVVVGSCVIVRWATVLLTLEDREACLTDPKGSSKDCNVDVGMRGKMLCRSG